MSETRETSRSKPTGSYSCSSFRAALGTFCVVAIAVGALCGVLASLPTDSASAQERTSAINSGPTLKQFQRAALIYRLDRPVELEAHIVKVELASTDEAGWQWRFAPSALAAPAQETVAESPATTGPAGFARALQLLEKFGKTTVLHSGVLIITGDEGTYVYSGKTVPVQKKGTSAIEYRELGQKLTINLEGIDARQRLCFSYGIDLSYIEGEVHSGDPTFANYNVEARAELRDGETLVIQNFDGSTALLIFLTPRIMG